MQKAVKRFEECWEGRLKTLEKMPVGEAAMKHFRRAAREDIKATCAQLNGSKDVVWLRWVDWYPTWVDAEIARIRVERPWLLMTEGQRRKAESERVAEVTRKARLFEMVDRVASALQDTPLWRAKKSALKKTLKVKPRQSPVFDRALVALRMVGIVKADEAAGTFELMGSPRVAIARLHDFDVERLV